MELVDPVIQGGFDTGSHAFDQNLIDEYGISARHNGGFGNRFPRLPIKTGFSTTANFRG